MIFKAESAYFLTLYEAIIKIYLCRCRYHEEVFPDHSFMVDGDDTECPRKTKSWKKNDYTSIASCRPEINILKKGQLNI